MDGPSHPPEDRAAPGGGVRLDGIRDQLRAMGYLRGPLSRVEGWMLAGRGGPSSFLWINAAASLRAALIGGPLLGVPAAAAVSVANRPHLGAPRDLLLLAIYLSVMLGAAVGGLEFLADSLIAWLGRRGLVLVGQAEKLAARVGLLFFVASTLYLASLARGGRAALARAQGEGSGAAGAWLVWVAAVLGALAVGHLVGRLTRIGSLAALVAARGGGGLAGRLAVPARRRSLIALGVAGLVLAAGLLVFCPPFFSGPSRPAAPVFTPAPLAGRIAVIGIDGLEAGWFDAARARGVCPALARIDAQGARYDLAAASPRVPPAVWTTLATGRPASQHGILGYQAEHVPGLAAPVQDNPESAGVTFSLRLLLPPVRPAASPVSSGMRRALAVWEILAEHGVTPAAVNWWATWPADAADGLVVSERAFARLAARQTPDRDAAPAALQADLATRFGADMQQVHDALARIDVAAAGDIALTSALIDAWHAGTARRLLDSGLAQVAFVYLPGLDIARARAAGSPQAGAILDKVASSLDAQVAAFLSMARPDDLVVVIGDPGRPVAGEAAPGAGLLMAWGGRVQPGRRARAVSPLDVAPTLLALAGFPRARDLPGAPVVDFLRVGDVALRQPPPIDSYGSRPEPLPGPSADPFGREVLDRLRSLGYIQ